MPNPGITAKFPAALVSLLADFGGSYPSLAAPTTLVLNTSLIAGDTSVISTTTIPASWPASGWITIDAEIIAYTSFASATFTVTRGAQGTTAASHTSGASIGLWFTPQVLNQMQAELIAVETFLGTGSVSPFQPNLVLNSDFGRRTVFGLAMPEVFADTSAWTSTSALSVAANVLTISTASRLAKWSGPNSMWRDGRWSASFKATATAGQYILAKWVDASDSGASGNEVIVQMSAGTFKITKVIAGVGTDVATVAQALTLNRWYWLELECQGTTYVAKLWDTGGTVPGVTKASSTLLQTLTGTISDAGVVSGGIAVESDQSSSQWGGIATGNGGVYVETWLPESWPVTFIGTLGGQAVGYDESADSGPLSRQNALRMYVPATSRGLYAVCTTQDGSVPFSTSMTQSAYMKVSGKGGSGALGQIAFQRLSSGLGNQGITYTAEAGETSWTRKTATVTTEAGTRRAFTHILANTDGGSAQSATGTVWFDLMQLEQGSAATAWRNAPADDGRLSVVLVPSATPPAITSATQVEVDSRSMAMNFLMPWDGVLELTATVMANNSGLNSVFGSVFVDGASPTPYQADQAWFDQAVAGKYTALTWTIRAPVAAGKHRVALNARVSAGTLTFSGNPVQMLIVTATRGK